ncbi:hypothetical protein AAK967_00570 [Atopobiaceae bacterium 24-176]
MLRLIDSHKGEDHVTSDDSRQFNARLFGAGTRAVISGMGCSLTGSNTVTVAEGYMWLDGARVRVQGADSVAVPQGTIGRRRRDLLCLVYERDAEGVESLRWEYLTGPAGADRDPDLPAAGSVLSNDARVWVPFARVPLNGLTVGAPTVLLPGWSPPACGSTASQSAQAAANEAARLARDAFESVSGLKAERAALKSRLDVVEARTDQVGAVAAALLGNWFFSHGALYCPVGWVTVEGGAAGFRASSVSGGALVLAEDAATPSTTEATGLYTTNAIKGLFRDAVAVADPK